MGNFFKSDSIFQNYFSNNPSKNFLNHIIFVIGSCLTVNAAEAQVIAGWNFWGDNIVLTKTASVFDPNLVSPVDLTRGPDAPASVGGDSYRTQSFRNDGISINNTDYFQIELSAKSGFQISLSTIDANFTGTATFAASPGVSNQFAYSLDGINFTLIGSPSIIIGQPKALSQIKLSGISALQNVPSGITVTIRYYASGQTSTGGWGFYSASPTSNGFQIGGSVTAVTGAETYFQSRQNGDWSSPSTWQSSPDNISWNAATKPPTKDVENILVKAGHTVKVSTPVSFDQTTVAGILELQNGGILNINDGEGDDLLISENGILKILTTANYTTSLNQSTDANINISKGGKITIGNGISSMGKGYETFATSTVNKWNDGSVFEFNDNNVFVIAALTYFPNALENEIPVFRISKVNGVIPASNDFFLNGLLELDTDITFTGAGHKTFRNGIRGTVTLTQLNAGKIKLTGSEVILTGAPLKLILAAVIDLSPQITNIPATATVIVEGKNVANPGNLIINGILDVTTISISNSGSIIVNGRYKTADPGGFSGTSSSITPAAANITLNPSSTIELYANGPQNLNTRTDFKNLVFSGSGTKTPKGPFKPFGTITIQDNAVFDCSGNINGTNIGDDNTNLTMKDNSRLIVSAVGTNPPIGGIYDLQGGVIEFSCSGATSQAIRNQTYQNIEVTGTNVNNSNGNIILKSGGTFTVKNGAIFTINDNTIAGPVGIQTVTVESGGTFKCGNTKGFHGFTITFPNSNSSVNADIENIILQPNSTVEYSRASPPLSSGDQPITNANNLIYQNLILSGTGNKTAPIDNLFIQGNFSKKGTSTFLHNNGTVIFNGNTAQTYTSAAPQVIFNILKNENTNGLNINDSLSVYKELFLADNSKINLNADITLLSNKYQTASVSWLPVNAVINYFTGLFIIERYINTNTNGGHGKSWQLVSTPAFGETVYNTWQEKGNKNISGYGTWITDAAGIGKGFDDVSFSPSMKYFDAVSSNWIGIISTHTNLEKEKGYMIFVRGDRNSSTLNSPPTPTILRTKGKLYSPQHLPPTSVVAAGKFQSVGNPYASAIDFSKIIRSAQIENSFRVWDPEYYGSHGFGGYQTISPVVGYKAVPGGSSIYNSTSDYRNIQSGQAFFVSNFSTNEGSVNFSEDCKIRDAHRLVNRESSSASETRSILFAKLIAENNVVVDGNAVAFDKSFSDKIDADDAVKISNSNENFGIGRNEKKLIVEARSEIKGTDTIFYNIENLSKKSYRLLFIAEKMQKGFEAYLLDQYLKTETPVNLKDTSAIDFLITSDAGSFIPNRFLLIFKPLLIPLEISLQGFQKNAKVFLEWKINNETEIKEYLAEHSIDGINFALLEIISASNYTGIYNQVDKQPANGDNYYRIRVNKIDGNVEYSDIVKVSMPEFCSEIKVFPNPIRGENINLLLTSQPAGNYQLRLINSSGQLMVSKEINFSGGNDFQTLPLKRNIAHGIYHLEIKKPDGTMQRLKVIY